MDNLLVVKVQGAIDNLPDNEPSIFFRQRFLGNSTKQFTSSSAIEEKWAEIYVPVLIPDHTTIT